MSKIQDRIVFRGGEGEIEEKKSRFIATVMPVHTEEEALAFIASMKKKYWNARHNCYAFILGENRELARCSDDGEPQGTAGRPMLEVLQGAGIHDAVVVVTRYFGGVLLGTGGLVRAYSKAVQTGQANYTVAEKKKGFLLRIRTDYTGIGKIQYLLAQRDLRITGSEYTEVVTLETLVPEEGLKELKAAVTEATGGKAEFLSEDPVCYAFPDGEPVILD